MEFWIVYGCLFVGLLTGIVNLVLTWQIRSNRKKSAKKMWDYRNKKKQIEHKEKK